MKRKPEPIRKTLLSPGTRLRAIRTRRGLTMQDVEQGCAGIAFRTNSTKYFVRRSQLSGYENDKLVPSIFKLYSLSRAYGCTMRKLLNCYLPTVQRR